MKRTLFTIGLFCSSLYGFAQEKGDTLNSHEDSKAEFGYGMLINPVAAHTFKKGVNDTGTLMIMPSINYLTKHSHSSIGYDIPSQTLALLNGWIFTKDKAVYVYASKSIVKKEYYASVGFEQGWDVSPHFDITLFIEIGTNFEGTTSTSAGAMFNIHAPFKTKKKK